MAITPIKIEPETYAALHLLPRSEIAKRLTTTDGPLATACIQPSVDVGTLSYVLYLSRWTTQHGPLLNGRFPSEQWDMVASRARGVASAPTLLDFCHRLWGDHKTGLGVPFTSLSLEDSLWIRQQSNALSKSWPKLRSAQNINEAMTYARFLDEMLRAFRNEDKAVAALATSAKDGD
jgi:hypothetical protein